MTELVVWNHIPPLDTILIAFLFHSVVRSGPLHLTDNTQERFLLSQVFRQITSLFVPTRQSINITLSLNITWIVNFFHCMELITKVCFSWPNLVHQVHVSQRRVHVFMIDKFSKRESVTF